MYCAAATYRAKKAPTTRRRPSDINRRKRKNGMFTFLGAINVLDRFKISSPPLSTSTSGIGCASAGCENLRTGGCAGGIRRDRWDALKRWRGDSHQRWRTRSGWVTPSDSPRGHPGSSQAECFGRRVFNYLRRHIFKRHGAKPRAATIARQVDQMQQNAAEFLANAMPYLAFESHPCSSTR